LLSALYAAAVRRRRERYAARPDLRLRLRHPVISIGNLAVGGRGKTPLAAAVARLLLERGERPAILSRGYGRAVQEAGAVVVSDGQGIRADLARAGDEPLMLARQLPGVVVVVGADRYAAGRLAEHHLGATVHVLDDGFQHLRLDRDLDLVIIGRDDVEHPVTLPFGRLREPLDTIVAADAVLTEDDEVWVTASGMELRVFRLRRQATFDCDRKAEPALAVAGIARPTRFFEDLRAHGWNLAKTVAFADHHRYSARDLARLSADASNAGAFRIVTTEKDYVRLLPFRPFPIPVACIRMTVEPDPLESFRAWLGSEIDAVRGCARG
jgi:tetraacyldisaccharide 4'-kinase